MNDSISRQAAIALADKLKDNSTNNERIADTVVAHNVGILEYQTALSLLPSLQPEIIRCKDCKHRPVDGEDTQGFGVEFPDYICPCQCDDGWYNWRPNDEWYCANAERREQ